MTGISLKRGNLNKEMYREQTYEDTQEEDAHMTGVKHLYVKESQGLWQTPKAGRGEGDSHLKPSQRESMVLMTLKTP
jgi:hypothetical protein